MAKKEQLPSRGTLPTRGKKGTWNRCCPVCGGPISPKRIRRSKPCAKCEKEGVVFA